MGLLKGGVTRPEICSRGYDVFHSLLYRDKIKEAEDLSYLFEDYDWGGWLDGWKKRNSEGKNKTLIK